MDLYIKFHVNRFILEKDITMVDIKTTLELPIAHCLDGAYSGLCVGNVSRDGETRFDLSTGLIPVLHGHNYFVTVDLAVDDDDLDSDGMVMDFKMMKKLLHEHFDMYDHSMILTPSNPLTWIYKKNYADRGINLSDTRIFIWPKNPTAEFMATRWRAELAFKFPKCKVTVTVEETSHNSVTCGE